MNKTPLLTPNEGDHNMLEQLIQTEQRVVMLEMVLGELLQCAKLKGAVSDNKLNSLSKASVLIMQAKYPMFNINVPDDVTTEEKSKIFS